jgi:hypothetical protein
MTIKEALPAFVWAGLVIGGTSLALAWLSSTEEADSANYHSDERPRYVSPFDR